MNLYLQDFQASGQLLISNTAYFNDQAQGYKTFSYSSQLSIKFQQLINAAILFCLKHLNVVLILLINVKISKFHAQLSYA